MKKKYSIGFFAVAAIAMIAVLAAYQFSYERALEKAKENALQAQIEKEEDSAVRTEGEASKEECYYLMDVNGYVVVYLNDKKTAFEYTGILVEELPATIREELKNGKYIEGEDTLYGFLENYSS